MASRSQFHEFKNIFLAGINSLDTVLSASSGVSMLSPGADKYLEVWRIDITGQLSEANAVGVELKDGSAGDVIRFVEVASGDTQFIDWGGFPKRFTTTVWLQHQGDGDSARVAIHYFEKDLPS